MACVSAYVIFCGRTKPPIRCLTQVIKYYADKVISLKADKAQADVAKQIDAALRV